MSRSFCAPVRVWSVFSDWLSIWRMRSRVTLNVRCVEARDSRGATRRIRLEQDSARAGIPVATASPFAGKAGAWVVTTETLAVDETQSSGRTLNSRLGSAEERASRSAIFVREHPRPEIAKLPGLFETNIGPQFGPRADRCAVPRQTKGP